MKQVLAVFSLMFVLFPKPCSASSYDRTLKRGAAGERKKIWSGKIVLKDGMETVGRQYIVKKDGKVISFDDLKYSDPKVSIENVFKLYNGLYGFGLRRNGTHLDLSGGRIDIKRQSTLSEKKISLMDVDALASIETKEIGVLDERAGIWIFCKAQ